MKNRLLDALWWAVWILLGIAMITGAVLVVISKGIFSVDLWRGLP